jgi:hydroxyacylglutathione hydrolase
MNEVADGVWQIPLAPRDSVNAYLIGDVIIDAGIASMGKKVVDRLNGHTVSAHAITHAHPDHVGGSRTVCDALRIPFWAPANDAAAAAAGRPVRAEGWLAKNVLSIGASWPPIEAARRLCEGDEVGGFTVLDVPGHSPGHIAFWRESDRVVVAGDVLFNLKSLVTLTPGLREPPKPLTVDPELNRKSIRRIASLKPDLALLGHGPPVTDAARKLRAFADRLPA